LRRGFWVSAALASVRSVARDRLTDGRDTPATEGFDTACTAWSCDDLPLRGGATPYWDELKSKVNCQSLRVFLGRYFVGEGLRDSRIGRTAGRGGHHDTGSAEMIRKCEQNEACLLQRPRYGTWAAHDIAAPHREGDREVLARLRRGDLVEPALFTDTRS
jgi:hypothetical protein